MTHPNEELLRKGYDAFSRGDLDTLGELFAPDITWHSPGNTPLSGEFNGQQEVFGNFAKIPQLTTAFDMEIHDVLANDEHAVGMVKMHIEREGRSRDGDAVHVYHVDGGKVTEAWVVPVDQAGWDEFWNA